MIICLTKKKKLLVDLSTPKHEPGNTILLPQRPRWQPKELIAPCRSWKDVLMILADSGVGVPF